MSAGSSSVRLSGSSFDRCATLAGDLPILVPGVGAQGGDVIAAVAAGRTADHTGLLLSSSREILYASSGDDFAAAARVAAQRMASRDPHRVAVIVSGRDGYTPAVTQRGFQGGCVLGAEHDPVVRRDVDQVEVDAGLGDTAGEVGEHSRLVCDVDDHDIVLVADCEVGQRQGVSGGLRMGHENVHLGTLPVAEAGRRGEVHPGVADGCRHPGQGARLVVHLDHQILVHRPPFRSSGRRRPRAQPSSHRGTRFPRGSAVQGHDVDDARGGAGRRARRARPRSSGRSASPPGRTCRSDRRPCRRC